MTANDTTAKPTVITAAQFVSEGYAAKIAAGECEVTQFGVTGQTIRHISTFETAIDYISHVIVFHNNWTLSTNPDRKLSVTWLQPADTTTESAAANAGGQGASGDNLATIIQAGWDAAFADSWYLNATPSDNPEGVEAVNPAIVAGQKAWLQLQAQNARLQTARATAEARADVLREALLPFAETYHDYTTHMIETTWFGDFVDYLAEFHQGSELNIWGHAAAKALEAPTTADGGVS